MNILNWREVWHAYQSHEKPAVIQAKQSTSALDSLRWAVYLRLTDSNSHLKSKCLFLLRSCLRPRTSLDWYAYLYQTDLRKVVRKDIALLDAIHRPFFDRNISPGARLRLMQNHFNLSGALFGKNQALDLLAGKSFDIANLQGKNEDQYRLSLFRCNSFKREGGLTLGLFQGTQLLQCLSFSFDRHHQQLSIRVGGVQSSKQDARELIRSCTKSLHGIQPRLLLIEALRCIAQELNCATIECIAKKNHIYQSWRYRFSKCIKAEYDALWQSAGAVPHSNGNYLLPLSVEEKPWSARPSNKRSEYRARDMLTTDMRKEIVQNLAVA